MLVPQTGQTPLPHNQFSNVPQNTHQPKIRIEINGDELRKRSLFVAVPMYGGNCTGVFNKSMADLSALCCREGIQLQLYTLTNESLITRARNYCCLPENSLVETEDGLQTIKNVVESKYNGRVLSVDNNNQLIWNKVVNHWRRQNVDKKWVGVKTSEKRKRLICTDDHLCGSVGDLFNPNVEYTPAKDLKGKWLVRRPLLNGNKNRNVNQLFNKQQMEVLLGTLLGDGHISSTGYVEINHSEKQKDYIFHKQQILGGSLSDRVWDIDGKVFDGVHLGIGVNGQSKFLRDIMYKNGTKSLSGVIDRLTPTSLAFWYMDDGSRNNNSATICTHSYSYEDHLLIQQKLLEWNIESNIKQYKSYNYISFDVVNSDKLWKLIESYIIPEMRYKLGEQYHQLSHNQLYDTNRLGYGVELVQQIDYTSTVVKRLNNSDLYDIEVENNHNFIANQSLVHNCDEFVRSGFTHMMFIDSDIGFNPHDVLALLALAGPDTEHDIIGAPYPKKCLHHSAKVLTEDGYKTISWIVNNKYSGNVLSYDVMGKAVMSKIINHWSEPNQFKKWVSLRTSKIRSRDLLTVTSDHDVAYINDVFVPKIEFARADSLTGKHIVVRPTKNSNKRFNALYNSDQLSVLLGTSLGDGCLYGGSIAVNHGPKQKEYVTHKSHVLNANLCKGGLSFKIKNAQTQVLSNLVGCGKTKTLKNVVDRIDSIALAYLYMDDGNLYDYDIRSEVDSDINWWCNLSTGKTKRSRYKPEGDSWIRGRKEFLREPSCSIATMSFSVEDNQLLSKHLKDAYDIDSTVVFQGSRKYNKKYPLIKFDSENTKKLHKLIYPYVHQSMEYKLIEQFRNLPKNKIDCSSLDYGAVVVDHIAEPNNKNNSYLFDIEVEGTHNFVANDVVVHNCIAWEKIKIAVDKGFADQNPNALENFVGDFVFNPKSGNGQIPLFRPVEVMELGTGFMMIQRRVFEKFDKEFKYMLYRPDHVRTKQFDGSRKIMSYFDCIIDRGYDFGDVHKMLHDVVDGKYTIEQLKQEASDLLKREDTASLRYLSEDYKFCYDAARIGMKIWMCSWMRLVHVGTHVFGGSIVDLAQLGVSATADINQLNKGS